MVDVEEEVSIVDEEFDFADDTAKHAVWMCSMCRDAGGASKIRNGDLIVAACGMLTRFGGDKPRCKACIAAIERNENRVCHYCQRRV